jgi:hypothetical protein
MRRLTVVAPCFYPDTNECKLFIESCERFNIHYHLYGLGEPWTWLYDAKVERLILELETINSEYILVNDGDDTFFLAGEDEIMKKYLDSTATILVSADRQQDEGDSRWPQSIFRDRYPQSPTPWRYCNSGGYIGKRKDILHLLYNMSSLKCPDYIHIYRSKDWNNDQFRMSVAYLNGYPLTIDTNCNLFQTMGCVESGEIVIQDDRIGNTVTKTKPSVVHFNGNALGIEEMYDKCLGRTIIQ